MRHEQGVHIPVVVPQQESEPNTLAEVRPLRAEVHTSAEVPPREAEAHMLVEAWLQVAEANISALAAREEERRTAGAGPREALQVWVAPLRTIERLPLENHNLRRSGRRLEFDHRIERRTNQHLPIKSRR